MNGYHIGLLIEQERVKKKISRKRLASGIFSQQMLAKLENDQCESDMLQVEMLIQRLGRSPDKLEVFMPMSEYKKIKMREMINDTILKGKTEKARYLLARYKDTFYKTGKVHQMYYYRTMAYLLARTGGDLTEALEYIKKALDTTLSGWDSITIKEYLISTYEMENLLAYGKILMMLGRVDGLGEHLEACLDYIETHYTDTEEYTKIYIKAVWLMAKLYTSEQDDMRILTLCEKALDYLRREAIGYFALPVMEETIWRYRRVGDEDKRTYWEKFYNVFKDVHKEYVPDMCLDSLFGNVYQRAYGLDFEYLKNERITKGYTQVEMAEGVYQSSKPLSQVENYIKTASKSNYEATMDKLGVEKRRYNGILATFSFDILQKYNLLLYFGCRQEIDSAEKVLKEIEEMLDMSIVSNKQFIESERLFINYRQGKISEVDAMERAKKALAQTYDIDREANRVPTRIECSLINQIGIYLRIMKKNDASQHLYRNMLKQFVKSKMDIRFNVRSYSLLNINFLSGLDFVECLEEAKKALRTAMKNDLGFSKTRSLSAYSHLKASMYEMNEYDEELCRREWKRAYVFHDFNYEPVQCEEIAEYYRKRFGEDIFVTDRRWAKPGENSNIYPD